MTLSNTSAGFLNIPLTALSSERLHAIFRRIADEDWAHLKDLMRQDFGHPASEADLEVLERLFRKGEAIARDVGGAVCQIIQAIAGNPPLLDEARRADERVKARVRFVLREMSEADWAAVKVLMEKHLEHATRSDDIHVLELVFRVGESVTNIELAAFALADKLAGRRLLAPEVAKSNAAIRSAVRGTVSVDPEAAYAAAKRALEESEELANRAENTLAYQLVRPASSYKHARNTVFRMVEAILACRELMAEFLRLQKELAAIKPVCRELMRWALHRMPIRARLAVLKFIPLNTILMFQHGDARAPAHDLLFKATRDRRLAFDLFVKGHSDDMLMVTYGASLNAVKNAVGNILQTLIERPIARRLVHEYLAQVESIPPMDVAEVRRLVKRINSKQRAELLASIPNCAWKVRAVMPVHKHLFLDYMSGEWVLGALVDYYNVHRNRSATGRFSFEGTLTVRGANAAIEGMLHKISEEPELRQQLRQWLSAATVPAPAAESVELAECDVTELLPALPNARTALVEAAQADCATPLVPEPLLPV